MRRIAALVSALLCCPVFAAASEPAPSVTITAQQIALYADRGMLLADGGVSIHTGALDVTATRALYDLRANTLSASGDVALTSDGTTTHATGYVYDYTKHEGHTASGLTLPQLSTSEAAAIAQQADVHPARTILFSNAQVRTGTTLTPVASYEYAIPAASSKDFGYSPVPSAALERAMLLTTGKDAYSFARVRYDRYNGGPGTGLEEHYARSDRGYLVLGQTLDTDGARFDVAAFERIDDNLTQSFTGSSLFGLRSFRYALNRSGRDGYASLSFTQLNGTRSDDLYLTTNQHPLARLGQLREQIDFGHDVHPFDYAGAQDLRVTPGLHFDSAGVRIGRSTLSSSADLGESLYSYGRATLATGVSFWNTFAASNRVQLTGGATFAHDAPPFPSTYRTYLAGMTWKASPAFNLVSSLTYTNDFGQTFGIGRPQFSAAFDVRFRRRNGTGVEIGTIIPFGTGDLYHAGAFNFRFFK